jgi:hypothetical protein
VTHQGDYLVSEITPRVRVKIYKFAMGYLVAPAQQTFVHEFEPRFVRLCIDSTLVQISV